MSRFFLVVLSLFAVACIAGACPPSVARTRSVSRSVITVATPAPTVSTVMVPKEVTVQKTVMTPTTVMVPKTVVTATVVNETKTVRVPVTTVSQAPSVAVTKTTVKDGLAFPVANRMLWGFRR